MNCRGVNYEESLEDSKGIESTEVSIDKTDAKESVVDNCNVYAVETRSGNLRRKYEEKQR